MGELREFLKNELPNYEDPVIFISSDYFPGCTRCNSSVAIYYITLTERKSIPVENNLVKVKNHKFPIDIYVNYSVQKGMPQKIVIGTKKSKGNLKMILRQIIE